MMRVLPHFPDACQNYKIRNITANMLVLSTIWVPSRALPKFEFLNGRKFSRFPAFWQDTGVRHG